MIFYYLVFITVLLYVAGGNFGKPFCQVGHSGQFSVLYLEKALGIYLP